jgi:vesicular inhibitory amino acid transporter
MPSNAQARPIRRVSVARPAGLYQTSLDIVWSFTRANAFYGSQLPSSPSFVNHYNPPRPRRPSKLAPKGSQPELGGDRQPRLSTDTEALSTSDRRFSESGASEDLSHGSEEDLSDEDEWTPGGTNEPLPKNAVKARRDSRRRPSTSQQPDSPRPEPYDPTAATEQTPLPTSRLLAPDDRPTSYGSLFADGDVPFARRAKSFSDLQNSDSGSEGYDGEDGMGPPVGRSTFAQSLFNSINVLVGVGILAERA